jgi:hypothetical protein
VEDGEMKSSSLPQPVTIKLLDLAEKVDSLTSEAVLAERALATARDIINFRTEVSKAEYSKVKADFDHHIHADAQAARQKADAATAVLQACRIWIAALPNNCKLILQHPVADPSELAALKTKLQGLRNELEAINRTVVAGDDIDGKIRDYVAGIAASPQITLTGAGAYQQIQCRWGDDNNALGLVALLHGDLLADLISRSIRDAHPLSHAQVQERRAAVTEQIDSLSYAVSCLQHNLGEIPDPKMAPHFILGVRVSEPVAEKIAV